MKAGSLRSWATLCVGILAAIWANVSFAQEEVKVGVLLPYTGVLQIQAQDNTRGFELYLKQVGGRAGGRRVVLIKEDDEANPSVGLNKLRKLIERDRVDLLFGPVHSGVALAIRDTIHANKVPWVISQAPVREFTAPHPLASHMEELARVVTHFSGELTEEDHEQPVCVAGEIAAVRPYKSRSGKDMGFVSLEDIQGTLELVIFNRVWQGLQGKLEPGQIVVARGRVDAERGEPKILVDELILDLDKIRALEPGPERGPQDPNRRPKAGPESHETPNGSNGGDPGDLPYLEEGLEAGGLAAELLDEPLPEAPPLDGRTPEGESMVWQLAESRQVTITLRSTGDQGRDAQRLRRIHGMLSSAPGGDHYSFLVYEASRCYHLEFPNSTTRYSLELHQLLMGLLGERAVQVEPLGLQ